MPRLLVDQLGYLQNATSILAPKNAGYAEGSSSSKTLSNTSYSLTITGSGLVDKEVAGQFAGFSAGRVTGLSFSNGDGVIARLEGLDLAASSLTQTSVQDLIRTTEWTVSPLTSGALIETMGTIDADIILRGSTAADTLAGGEGDDRVYGSDGADSLSSYSGNDTLYGGNGADRLESGALAVAYGGAGRDVIIGAKSQFGGAGNDVLTAGLSGRVDGGSGNDRLSGHAGAEKLLGRAGNDRMRGLAGDDTLRGGIGNDKLNGGSGNDRLRGDSGADTLTGGAGADSLSGGKGADLFIFASGSGQDRLSGLEAGLDRLQFSGAVDATVTAEGVLLTQRLDASSQVLILNAVRADLEGIDNIFFL